MSIIYLNDEDFNNLTQEVLEEKLGIFCCDTCGDSITLYTGLLTPIKFFKSSTRPKIPALQSLEQPGWNE